MEIPTPIDGEPEPKRPAPAGPQPMPRDLENERARREIAERMEAEYVECLR